MGFMAERTEDRRPIPVWEPTILFTEEEVAAVDWEAVFKEWMKNDDEETGNKHDTLL
jgi:hypothetical protein